MESNHEILILFGSQTGTAKEISEMVARELSYREFHVKIDAMDDYEIKNLPNEKIILFIVSTTGQGDPPDNMKNFWKFLLLKDIPSNALNSVQFSVFGLGDSGYQKFNAMARKLNQRLLQIGAKEFHEKGLGDEQNEFGLDAELIPWLRGLWEKLKTYFPNKTYEVDLRKMYPTTRYSIRKQKANQQKNLTSLLETKFNNLKLKIGKVSKNMNITGEDPVRKVRFLEIEADQDLSYSPGDVASILPRNDPDTCKKLAELLGYEYDDEIHISLDPNSKFCQNPFPPVITIREIFEFWLKITEPPNRYFFHVLSFFTQDLQHAEKLRELGSNTNEGKNEYNKYCYKEKRNVFEILFDFDTVKLPLEYLLEIVSLQKFRDYSISTSDKVHQNSFGITVAITSYLTPYKRNIIGICSGWFDKLGEGEIIPFYLKKGTLLYPENPSTPVICVGPGKFFKAI